MAQILKNFLPPGVATVKSFGAPAKKGVASKGFRGGKIVLTGKKIREETLWSAKGLSPDLGVRQNFRQSCHAV
jgi:hypothetical protein